ncbi:MAG: DUF4384 domain-containing protein [Candidatus Sumerlaeaceae bacterium]
MRLSALRFVLGLFLVASAALAGAVGVAHDGAYRVHTTEREPADPGENIRIVPPPTGGVLKVDIRTDKARYHVYDPMQVFFSVNRDSYVYVFDTDPAGITRQIFPNYYDTDNYLRAGKTYYVPDRGYDLEVTGPQGRSTLTIVALVQDFHFLNEYRYYTRQDPYPASREGATAMVRQIEQFRAEPSALGVHPLRPALKENIWAVEHTTYYVMGNERVQPPVYKTPRYGRLDIDSYPSNARIYIDADYYGRTSQVIDRLEIGYHRLRLEKEGYLPYECHIYIKGNETKQMDIFLTQTPVMPAQEKHDGQMRGGSTFGFFNENAEGAGAACPPGTVPVMAPVAPAPQQKAAPAWDEAAPEK